MAEQQTYTPKIFIPAYEHTTALNVVFNQPLDNRVVVRTKADLKALETSGRAYSGMVVVVAEENKSYILKPGNSALETNNLWLVPATPSTDDADNFDNWVPASNSVKIVNYLHSNNINTSNLGEMYCVIVGGKDASNTQQGLADEGWQKSGLYAVIEGTTAGTVKLHSLLSGGTIEQIAGQVSTLETTVDNLSTAVETNTTDIANLSTRVEGVVTNLGKKADTTTVDALTTRVSTAETNITGLETRVGTAEANISTNTTDIANLKTTLGTAPQNYSSNIFADIAAVQSGLNDFVAISTSVIEGYFKTQL